MPRPTALAVALPLIAACWADARPGLAPSVDAGPDVRTHPREPVALAFRLGGSWGTAGPWTYTIDWGDGVTGHGIVPDAPSPPPVTASHAYAAVGRRTVRVSVAEQGGDDRRDTLTAFVEAPGTPQVFVGAGDIATCTEKFAAATAQLLDGIPGTVFALGDNAYPSGTDRDYSNCYGPTWGRHKKRTHPVPGNHDYDSRGAAGYYSYFGVVAGDPDRGYYSYDLGDWHIVALNSNLYSKSWSQQEQWLRADLAAHRKRCTLAYFHEPRFSSGTMHGSQPRMQVPWQALYDAGADVVLSGHEHNYERFAPQTPDGRADSARGIREFVVGTGGGSAYKFGTPIANSEARSMDHGVLKLTLGARSYQWQFIPIAGSTFTDSGSGGCH